MKKTTYLLIFSFISLNAIAEFNWNKDNLCFLNADPELAQFGPLGKLGSKKGVCQGMSGLVSAFKEFAQFKPKQPKINTKDAFLAIRKLRRLHSGNCNTSRKIVISGYSSLYDFCQDHKMALMKHSINYNADIAIKEIARKLGPFFFYKSSPVQSKRGLKRLKKNLKKIEKKWKNGKWPLLLIYSHVMTVYNIEKIFRNKKLTKMIFHLYDSNRYRPKMIIIKFDAKGLPLAGQRMIWDITPNRITNFCW